MNKNIISTIIAIVVVIALVFFAVFLLRSEEGSVQEGDDKMIRLNPEQFR